MTITLLACIGAIIGGFYSTCEALDSIEHEHKADAKIRLITHSFTMLFAGLIIFAAFLVESGWTI